MSTETETVYTDELTALKLLAAGHSIAFTAAASGLSDVETATVARRYGNRPDALVQAAQELQQQLERALLDELPDSECGRHDRAAERQTTS